MVAVRPGVLERGGRLAERVDTVWSCQTALYAAGIEMASASLPSRLQLEAQLEFQSRPFFTIILRREGPSDTGFLFFCNRAGNLTSFIRPFWFLILLFFHPN